MRRIFTALTLCLLFMIVIEAKPVHAASNIIYGSHVGASGFPVDATVKQVSFTRSGSDLVTAFQVVGKIAALSYTYQIGVQFSSRYVLAIEDHPYRIILTSAYDYGWAFRCFLWNKALQSRSDLRCEVTGDTWTAWTPLSMIENKAHFWVHALTQNYYPGRIDYWGLGFLTTGSWSNDYVANSKIDPNYDAFEITFPARVTFTVQPSSIANKVLLTLDGTQQNFDTSGQLSIMMDSGTSHTVTIAPNIQASNNTRYMFSSWSDSGSQGTRSLNVEQDSSISVRYTRQFLLAVSSDLGNVSGGGWHDEASSASFSLKPTQLPYDGFLGMLGVQHEFAGWTGDVASTGASSSISMDGPKTVQAKWTTAYGPLLYGLIGLIIGAPLIAGLLLYKRRGRST